MRLSWLLIDELAIGTAPTTPDDLDRLEQEGVRSVLSLCAVGEAQPPAGLEQRFLTSRLVLPDHRCGRPPRVDEIQASITLLGALICQGPVYLHCMAGVERSPLVAVAWLMLTRNLTLQTALEYAQQCHPGTSPLPEQLMVLRHWSATLGGRQPQNLAVEAA